MGAHDLMATLNGSLNIDDVRRHFEKWQEEDAYESGQGAYAGNWTTFRGLKFKNTVFENEEAAREYILDYHEKWSPALAVRFKHTDVTVVKKPTFGGAEHTGSGKPIFQRKYQGMGFTPIPADQMTDAQKDKCVKLVNAHQAANKSFGEARDALERIVRTLYLIESHPDYSALRKARTAYVRATKARDKAKAQWEKFVEQQVKKLYKEKISEGKTKWLVGGWAAS